MKKSILILGGARSGKSDLAERMLLKKAGRPTYISTAEAYDDEMKARIAAHQARRGEDWAHLHAPVDVRGALSKAEGPILVDCLTLWLTNLMLGGSDWKAEGAALAAAVSTVPHDVIFVSNEVGQGIVPENKLARDFRDAAGWLNQEMAHACDEMWFVMAGQALRMKPNDTAF